MADPGTSLVFSYPFFLRGMADTGTSFDFSCPFSFQSFCKLLLDCCGFIIGLSCLYFTTVNSLTEPLFYNVLCFLTSAVVKSWACTVNKADFPLTYARLCFSSFSSLSSGHPWDMNTLYEVSSWISFYFRPKLPIISTTSFTQNISGNLMEVFFLINGYCVVSWVTSSFMPIRKKEYNYTFVHCNSWVTKRKQRYWN